MEKCTVCDLLNQNGNSFALHKSRILTNRQEAIGTPSLFVVDRKGVSRKTPHSRLTKTLKHPRIGRIITAFRTRGCLVTV